jgi:hypothetical protein
MAFVELPADPAPNGVDFTVLDFGANLRPGGGASVLRINRPGARLRLQVTFPPMEADEAMVFNRRFMTAQREGLRLEYPLLGVDQGAPGTPVVDGADPTGTTLPLRGLTPGYEIKEGYVLTLVDGDDNRTTHFAGNTGTADGAGEFTITSLEPPIRTVLADGDTVILDEPTIDLALTGNVGWMCSIDRLIRGATIEGEECAGLDPALGA